MAGYNVSQLNQIVKDTIRLIEKSKEAIYDIAEGARNEYAILESELNKLQLQTEELIKRSDELELALKISRKELAYYSKNFDKYNQQDIHDAYDRADNIRVELAVNRERERNIIIRRNDLERRLIESSRTVEKAEFLINQVATVMDYLSGDLGSINIQLEDAEKRKYLAIRVIKAQEEERRRVAREIHDGPAQTLSSIVHKLEICERHIDTDLEKAREELKNLKRTVRDSLIDVRRIIYDLRPMSIEDLGLIPTLEKYIEKFSLESDIQVNFQIIGVKRDIQDKNVTLTIFRIVQEALNNIRNHSNSKTAEVVIEFLPLRLVLKVSDRGIGFDSNEIKVDMDDTTGGFGLFSMKERIELLDGTLDIDSRVGKGTTIRVTIPYDEK
ncbi:MAG: sensor histidine kinase [Clostridiaceae bacterium]|nr:sensor histidine kinase [Clostridiaceae bacterium]